MKKRRTSRILSILLLAAMLLSLMPATLAYAEDTATWTQTSLEAITEDDVVAITMTNSSGKSFILPNAAATSKGPVAESITPDGGTLTTSGSDAYAWMVFPNGDGTYYITGPNGGLRLGAASNTGVRVSGDSSLWSFEQDHLTASDPNGAKRFIGATTAGTSPDWRSYTSVNNNIAGTTYFWVLNSGDDSGDMDLDDGELPLDDIIPTPVPSTEPDTVTLHKMTEMPVDGDLLVIYHAASGTVLSAEANGKKLNGLAATVTDDTLPLADGMAYMDVKAEDGVYTFLYDGKFLTSGETGNSLTFADEESDYSKWTLEQQDDGSWYIVNASAVYNGTKQALEYYNGFTTFGVRDNNAAYKFDFFAEIEEVEPSPEPTAEPTPEPTEEPADDTLVKLTAAPADGDQLVIYYPAGSQVMTATASGSKLAGTAATVTDNKLTKTADMAYMTVKLADGIYTFELDGKFLTSGETGNSLTFADAETECSQWTLEQQADGTWYIKNVGAAYNGNHNQALEYFNGFTTYGVKTDNAAYKFEFFGKSDSTEPTPEPTTEPTPEPTVEPTPEPAAETLVKLTEAPADGDQLVIYHPASSSVMTATASGSKLAGTAATVTDDKLTKTDDMAFLTVKLADGIYTFELDGKFLTSGETGNSLTFADAETEFSQWTLEQQADGTWYIKNVGAAYNGNHNQALEYFNGFTTYGVKTDSAAYKFEFFGKAAAPAKTGLVTDLADLTDGSYVVIYNPGNQVAMTSETINDWYLAKADATVADGQIAEPADNQIWKVSVSEDGVYTFTQANYAVTAWLSGNYVELTNNPAHDGAATGWKLDVCNAETSTFYMYSSTLTTSYGNSYIEAYEKKISGVSTLVFCGYSTGTEKLTEKSYGMQFYLVPAPSETPVEPTGETYGLTSKLADGDKVILYNAASGMALGNSLANYKVAGIGVTPVDGVITTDETALVWTVTVNADGTYTFTQDGYTLGGSVRESGDKTYNNITLTDPTYTGWTLTGPDSSNFNYFMYLDEMASSFGKTYLEYYSGFTLYGSSNPDKTAFGITFYKQGADPETPSGGEEPADDSIKVGTLVTSLDQLTDGQTVLIYSPGHKTAASSMPNGDWYLKADPVTDTFTADLVWTVSVEDGVYKFANGENMISAWLSGTYVELTVNPNYNSETASGWKIDPCNEANHTWYIYSSTLQGQYGNCYIEAYTRNGSEVFSGYSTTKLNEKEFGLQFYIVNPEDASEPVDDGEWDGVMQKGGQYAVYSTAAQAVFGIANEANNSLTAVPATISGGKAQVGNGALVFTVDTMGRYYTFKVGDKYLATNAAEDLFFQDEVDEYAKWYLQANGSGYTIYNKAARYSGTPVCIEYFSSVFSGWTFKSNDADIFRFLFYPVADGTVIIDGVAQVPTVLFDCEDNRYVEQDYAGKFTLDDLAETIEEIEITYTAGDKTGTVSEFVADGKTYTFTIPAEELDSADAPIASFTLTVKVKNSNGIEYTGVKTVTVLDEPFFGALKPAANAQTLDDKTPEISAEIGNVGEDAVFTMTVNEVEVEASFADGKLVYQPTEPMADGRYTVTAKVVRADGKTAEKTWSFYVGKAQFQLYFGQLHSHTTYSDGSGTLESALDYIAAIPASANVQFVAFTDHSNYFDSTSAANPEQGLYDTSVMTAASQQIWAKYKQTVAEFNAKQSDLIAIAGFEMTWSGGPGHINTFNSPGIVSRNNTTLNNKTNDAGMKAYYALLDQEEGVDTLSQFNHPGTTFGNFTDFSYWDPVTDSRIFLVEVGNGEGQIGAGGYYPSYEQYILALDKGWHVAPTNNQDNHKGRWGNANDARDVVYTDNFSEQGIYDAIRQYRVYATEDKNLEINYTVNEQPMGTIFSEVPEKLNVAVTLYDPDSTDSISKVEVVVNSGKVAHTWTDANEISTGLLEVELDPTYTYYFIRVTQSDGDLAVTAPVWVGESLKLGISEVKASQATPVTGEELTLTTTFYNSESANANVKSIAYAVKGGEVLGTDTAGHVINANSNGSVDFKFTPDKARRVTIDVTAIVELNGEEYTFTKSITLEIKDADKLVYIGIDASHYNEYVAGNYKDSMTNFSALAAEYGVRTVQLNTSEELIAACGNEKYMGIFFTAPSRRDGTALRNPYATYSDEELAAIKAFNDRGGMVVVTGWGDYYESYAEFPAADHMAAQQNKLLEALGSSIRIGDDEVVDDALNGGQNMRLYFSTYNFESPLMEGVIVDPENPNDRNYSEVFSNYGGASVYFTGSTVPATVTPVVYGHESTYTIDNDNDGLLNSLKYAAPNGDERVVVMATEDLGKGLIVVSGAAFMSNFEVQAQLSDGSSDADTQKNYSNYKVCENLIKGLNELEVTPIATVQAETDNGVVFTIEGTVTSNASGYDKDTAFFDCIYIQDETGGICCFPVAGNYKIGDVVRITGYTDAYQGEMELQVMSIAKIGETDPVEPKEVTAKEVNDRSVLGSLVTVKGTVESFEIENGLVLAILVKDAAGDVTRVFIDGYITTGHEVENLAVGAQISATGVSSYDDTWHDTEHFPRIRVRDRADVVCVNNRKIEVEVFGTSLLAKGETGINFYLTVSSDLLADKSAYVTLNGEKNLISKAAKVKSGGAYRYRFTCGVPAKNMNDAIELRVYNGQDELVGLADNQGKDVTDTGFLFSVHDYILKALTTSDEKLHTLVKAMSDFGSSVQRYKGYKVDTAPEYYNDLDAITTEDMSAFAMENPVIDNMGLQYVGSNLMLESAVSLRHFFQVTSGSIEDYTFTADGVEIKPVKSGKNYVIDIPGIAAKSFDQAVNIVITDAEGNTFSFQYSIMNYAYKAASNADEKLANVGKTLYLYNLAAKAYFG